MGPPELTDIEAARARLQGVAEEELLAKAGEECDGGNARDPAEAAEQVVRRGLNFGR